MYSLWGGVLLHRLFETSYAFAASHKRLCVPMHRASHGGGVTVREQVAQYNRHQTQDEAPVHSTGHSIGFHPEDKPSWTGEQDTQRYVITRYKEAAPEENDDAFSVPQSHTSTRRYASSPTVAETRTVMRVTHHQAAPPIQRASRLIQQPARLQVQGRKRPRHSYKFVEGAYVP